MFTGECTHTLDNKGRLTIPARYREELQGGLVITRGDDPCLVIWPPAVWQAMADKVSQMPKTSRKARAYSRRFFGSSQEAALDKMGRVVIPGFLREYAGIDGEAFLVGLGTLIEVWQPARWRMAQETDDSNLDDILDDLAEKGI